MRKIMFIGIMILLMSGCSQVGEIDKNKIPGEKIYKLSTGQEVALPLRYKNWKWMMATYTKLSLSFVEVEMTPFTLS